ncbi:MAG: hypothetical protein KBT01_03750 [Clostridiales bacterium]|nr:hypothetical protein [Candidatus Blautia equi]
MRKRLFESEDHFMVRVKREEILAKTGVKKSLFETDQHYEERAKKEYRDKTAGIEKKLFESREHFELRQEAAITEKSTGIERHPGEEYDDYVERAEREALCRKHHLLAGAHGHHLGGISEAEHRKNQIHAMEEMTNVGKKLLESEDHYYHRLRTEALAVLGKTTKKALESKKSFIIRSRIEALKHDPELVERLGLDKWEE